MHSLCEAAIENREPSTTQPPRSFLRGGAARISRMAWKLEQPALSSLPARNRSEEEFKEELLLLIACGRIAGRVSDS